MYSAKPLFNPIVAIRQFITQPINKMIHLNYNQKDSQPVGLKWYDKSAILTKSQRREEQQAQIWNKW